MCTVCISYITNLITVHFRIQLNSLGVDGLPFVAVGIYGYIAQIVALMSYGLGIVRTFVAQLNANKWHPEPVDFLRILHVVFMYVCNATCQFHTKQKQNDNYRFLL